MSAVVYLDNAATSFPKAPGVAAAMAEYVEKVGATINRSSYAAAQEAGLVTLTLREQLCRLFDHPDPTHAVITAGATASLNLLIKGLLRPGDHCVVSSMEHNAVMRPLVQLERDMEELIAQLRPEAIAVEELFFSNNITTGIAVAHARGIILCTAAKSGIPLFEYTPMQVKQAVVGYGLAEKRQVMDMVRRLLKLKAVPRPDDAADALALAICHARSATSLLARAQNPVKQTV